MASQSSARLAYLHNHPERLTDELFSHGCRHSLQQVPLYFQSAHEGLFQMKNLFCFKISLPTIKHLGLVQPRFDSQLLNWHYSDIALTHDGKRFTGSMNSSSVCLTQRYNIVDYIGASLFNQKILLLFHKSKEFQSQLVYFDKYLAILFVFVFSLSQFSVSYSKVCLAFSES